MKGDILAEYNGVTFVTRNCLHICFGEKIWAWPLRPLREHPQYVLDPLLQLEILFYGIPLPNPNILFKNLLPVYSKMSVPEYLSAEPTCTLLQIDKGFHVTETAGEEALSVFSSFLY